MNEEKIKERKINKKSHITHHTSNNKGITLVALIITIIVLLILAVVAIRAVQGDGIISKAKEAAKQTNIAQEKEELQMAVLEWQLVNKNGNPTLFSFLSEKYGEDSVQLNVDKSITVTMPSENRYKVTTSGEAILLDGTVEEPEPIVISITLDKTSITKEITSGSTGTETLTATLNNAIGDLTWISSDSTVAEISGEGNTKTITLKKAGTATITVSYGTANEKCSVTITEKVTVAEPISVGSYVKYNVGYTDMYLTGKNYNATNGWRLLSATPVEGQENTYADVKLISTGIPAKMNYNYSTNATTNGWWVPAGGTTEFKAELTRLGDNSYTTYSSANETDSNYPAMRAAAGMYYNFETISFKYGTSNDANKGFYTSITKYGATTQEDITYSENSNATATPTGGELFNLYGDNAKVRLLTLPELNMAVRPTGNTTNIDNTTQISEAEDPTGLFRLNKLDSAYTSGYYWLASPYPDAGYRGNVCRVADNGHVSSRDNYDCGVRPVVCLTSNIQLLDTNGDGVLEIQ